MKVIVNKGSVVADEELLDRAENYAVHLFYHKTKLATDAGFCHLTKYEETQ